jgi:hypothetical protein
LGQPVLNIVNPTSLPDPTGVGAVLGAVQNGSIFRDMSGLAATIGLAGTLSGNATNASTEAGRQAAANLAVAAQKDIESQRIAAQLALAALGVPGANAGTPKNISEGGALLNTAAAMDAKAAKASGGTQLSGGGEGGPIMGGSDGGGTDSGGGEVSDGSFMPGVGGSSGTMSRADDVRNRLTWGNLGLPAGSVVLATQGKSTPTLPGMMSGTNIYELSFNGTYPNPFPSLPVDEGQAIQNNTWSPSDDDFQSVGRLAMSSSNTNVPFAQFIGSLQDIFDGVKYFAPMVTHVFPQNQPFAARVKRLNLLVYAKADRLNLEGTLSQTGVFAPGAASTNKLKTSVITKAVLDSVRTATANKQLFIDLQQAWAADAEAWLYTSGGVANDALCGALAKFLGIPVRAFDKKFWVLSEFNPLTQKVDRFRVGIGADYASASANPMPDLKSLDSLSTRRFP